MQQVCTVLVLITYVYHNAQFKERTVCPFVMQKSCVLCEVATVFSNIIHIIFSSTEACNS
jgi:hypothetical protein